MRKAFVVTLVFTALAAALIPVPAADNAADAESQVKDLLRR